MKKDIEKEINYLENILFPLIWENNKNIKDTDLKKIYGCEKLSTDFDNWVEDLLENESN